MPKAKPKPPKLTKEQLETKRLQEQSIAAIKKWRIDPKSWVEDVLGINRLNGFKISNQQEEVLSAAGLMVQAREANWAHERQGTPIPEELQDMATKFGISVRSGKGTGKDAASAWLILWFLCNFPRARIPCVGPNAGNLTNVLWPEVSKWLSMKNHRGEYCFKDPWRSNIILDREKIYWAEPGLPNIGKQWLARKMSVQKSTDEEAMKNVLGGQHEDYMCVIVDEAAGVPRPVFEPLENSMTSICNFAILIWNPNVTSGFAYDTHYEPEVSKMWHKLHWNAEESDNVSQAHLDRMATKYGKDSDNYRVYVLGEPPSGNDDSLIPLAWVHEAIEREVPHFKEYPILMGLDPAGAGTNETIACIRQGPKVKSFHRINKTRTQDIVDDAMSLLIKNKVSEVYIDSIGVGKGVFDGVKRYFRGTHSIEVSNRARAEHKFRRLRDELWYKAREKFEHGLISIPNEKPLVDQLSSVTYDDMQMMGKIVVESKQDMKKRLGGDSPDYADALIMTFYHDDLLGDAVDVNGQAKIDSWREAFAEDSVRDRMVENSWMMG